MTNPFLVNRATPRQTITAATFMGLNKSHTAALLDGPYMVMVDRQGPSRVVSQITTGLGILAFTCPISSVLNVQV